VAESNYFLYLDCLNFRDFSGLNYLKFTTFLNKSDGSKNESLISFVSCLEMITLYSSLFIFYFSFYYYF
jgi:hypothetical protein